MKITHLTSSTQIIHVGASRVLTDPWLIDGEYYGSWHHAPPYVGPVADLVYDYIYLSHIHPDHFSRKTFALLPRSKPILIHKYQHKFLQRNLDILGFQVIELEHNMPFRLEGGQITILAADNCNPELCAKFMGCGAVESKFGSTQIDTLALFEDAHHTVLNINDCPFELANATLTTLLSRVPHIDLLLVGYTGAGPYPQCFTFEHEAEQEQAANRKKLQFLKHGLEFIKKIKPTYYMPFAGTYVLGGRMSHRNEYRGAADLHEAGEWFAHELHKEDLDSRLIQLDSLACFDLEAPDAHPDFHPWTSDRINRYASEDLAEAVYDFDHDLTPSREQLEKLFQAASVNFFKKKREISYSSTFVLGILISETEAFMLDLAGDRAVGYVKVSDIRSHEKYVTISLDLKLLFRLLRGPMHGHWNNAEIGSHLTYDRKPNAFERSLYHCICFLHI